MLIHLKRNEKLYLNGAVIRLDRRGTVELLNDASFLMEAHIMQPELATTPLKQIYYLLQLMLMDPQNANLMQELFKVNMAQLRSAFPNLEFEDLHAEIESKVSNGEFYVAMKCIRQAFPTEEKLLRSQSEANKKAA